ncbi:MAG TPA: CAP domain-containing protein [Gaiellaceae bacterium]|nr:CAP domain-containing protein [Gaiellaceae bacterium]
MRTRAVKGLVTLACAAALAVAVTPIALSSTSSSERAHASVAALETGVLDELNEVRADHGLPALRDNPALSAAATQHSREMGLDGYFDHDSANGSAFWARIAHWYSRIGFSQWSVGENLLWSSPDVAPSAAISIWMHSPVHRANILDARWREVGIGAVHFDGAGGAFGGRAVTIVTADFGVRR